MHPPFLLDVVQVDKAARVRVAVRRGEDAAPRQLQRLLLGHIVAVLGVEHAVGEGLARSDAEQVPREPGAVRVDVVEGGAFLGGYL